MLFHENERLVVKEESKKTYVADYYSPRNQNFDDPYEFKDDTSSESSNFRQPLKIRIKSSNFSSLPNASCIPRGLGSVSGCGGMCLLCGCLGLEGELGPLLPALHCHTLCIKFAKGIKEKKVPPKDSDIVREVKRARNLACFFCSKMGATVSCSGADCKKSYHFHCAVSQGCSIQYSGSHLTYCPLHHPAPPLPPSPLPACHHCSNTLVPGVEWVQCPKCLMALHTTCLAQTRPSRCPKCGDVKDFANASNSVGVRVINEEEEAKYVAMAPGAPSDTINYLYSELKSNSPMQAVRSNKNSPVASFLAQQKSPQKTPRMNSDLKSPKSSPVKTAQTTPKKRETDPSPRKILQDLLEAKAQKRAIPPDVPAGPVISSKKPKCSPFWKEYASKKKGSKVVVVQHNTSSEDGPLSDIDDILMGNVPEVDTHPLASYAFSNGNPHLEKLLHRRSNPESDPLPGEEESPKEKVKRPRKKRSDAAKKPSPRKSVLVKQHNKKIVKEDQEEPIYKRKLGKVRKLPLEERQIYHGRNWIPMKENEVEAECECSWVMDFTRKRREELVDVNSGEQIFMDIWNKHVNEYQGRGFFHMENILEEFLNAKAEIIIERNLYKNFMAHVVNLQSLNFLSADIILKVSKFLQLKLKEGNSSISPMASVLEEQREKALRATSRMRKKSATGRARPNSHFRDCKSPVGSPSRGGVTTPRKAATSPRRFTEMSGVLPQVPLSPSRPISLGRGKRVTNVCINVQKLSPSFHKSLSFDLASSSQKGNLSPSRNKVQVKSLKPAASTNVTFSEPDSCPSTDSELSTLIQNLTPGKKDGSSDENLSIVDPQDLDNLPVFHILTDEPDDSEEEMDEDRCASPPPEEDEDPDNPTDYVKLQKEAYDKKMISKPDKSKVLVFYVDDSLIEKARDRRSSSQVDSFSVRVSGSMRKREFSGPESSSSSGRCSGTTPTPASFTPTPIPTSDLEISFPGMILEQAPSNLPSPSKPKMKKPKLRVGSDFAALDELERTEKLAKEVKSDLARQGAARGDNQR